MEEMFKVTIMVNDGKGKSEAMKGTVSFVQNPNDYGNGYHMNVKMPDEPWGTQGYDIRYDDDFSEDDMISYIVRFYAQKYSGKKSAWKLIGIRVHEAEEIE